MEKILINRKQFLGIAAGTIAIAGVTYYLSSDKHNFVRADIQQNESNSIPLKADLETGKRLQRLWLKVRDKSIAIHPMTQIIEETETHKNLNTSLGITEHIQFLLRVGYLKNYPEAVSVRRAVEGFVRL